jgi:hypothetical protein
MKDKIYNFFVKELEDFELKQLLKDIELNSGNQTASLIKKRLRQIERSKQKICVTCGKDISEGENKYVLTFGPEGFQKRAAFCATDCLNHFLETVEKKDAKKRLF